MAHLRLPRNRFYQSRDNTSKTRENCCLRVTTERNPTPCALRPRPVIFLLLSALAYAALALPQTGCSGADQENEYQKETPVAIGVFTDTSTGLMWQDPLFLEQRSWVDAVSSCDALKLAGYDNWRLPTIGELRSLARDCAATVTGGACGVTDDCLENACFSSSCNGCTELGGPSPDGCYRLPNLTGDCMTTWTSSVPPDMPERAWTVGFAGCHVLTYPKDQTNINTRCVR